MRYLMYSRSYGDKYRAVTLFNEIPAELRDMVSVNSLLRKAVSRKIAIGTMMKEAVAEFA